MKRNIFRTFATVIAAIFSFAIFTPAQTSPSNFPGVKIGNFGQMDEHYFRGAQPMPEDYQSLKDLGVKTVVDLRNDPTDYEKNDVEKLGMKYVNIPMSGWKSPKDEDVQQFLGLLNNPETGTVYVHCKAGIHRTGITAAIYRMEKYGWDYDKAYQEMKNYNFSAGLVHGALKGFVKDYSRHVKAPVQTAAIATPALGTSN